MAGELDDLLTARYVVDPGQLLLSRGGQQQTAGLPSPSSRAVSSARSVARTPATEHCARRLAAPATPGRANRAQPATKTARSRDRLIGETFNRSDPSKA